MGAIHRVLPIAIRDPHLRRQDQPLRAPSPTQSTQCGTKNNRTSAGSAPCVVKTVKHFLMCRHPTAITSRKIQQYFQPTNDHGSGHHSSRVEMTRRALARSTTHPILAKHTITGRCKHFSLSSFDMFVFVLSLFACHLWTTKPSSRGLPWWLATLGSSDGHSSAVRVNAVNGHVGLGRVA